MLDITHDIYTGRTTVRAARLHRGNGERIILLLLEDGAKVQLATGAALKLTLKPKGVRDTVRLAYVSLTAEDLHANSGTYRKVFSTRTTAFNELLGVDGQASNDKAVTTVEANFTHLPGDSSPEEPGDTFELFVENTPYDADDASPINTTSPDDDWVAHGHVQNLTDDQKNRALSNIGAAGIDSPSFTGNPSAPTRPEGDDSASLANTAFVKTAIEAALAALLNGAPEALDTLKELADALGNDADFAAAVTSALSARLVAANNLGDLTDVAAALANLGVSILIADALATAATLTFNEQGTAGENYALALGDGDGRTVVAMNVPAEMLAYCIIPPNATVPLPLGRPISIMQRGPGQVRIIPTLGTTLNGTTDGPIIDGQWKAVTIVQMAIDAWWIVGPSTPT